MTHSIRERKNIDFDWRFSLSDVNAAKDELYDDLGWRMLDLPHDWSIEGNYERSHLSGNKCGFLPTGIGWYRKTLHVESEWLDRKIYIEFDGIYMNSEVWINGHFLGKRPNGYVGFKYELTPYLHTGANVIAVRVDCSLQPSSRWYNGSGINRHVWLNVVNDIHVAHWGTYVTTPEVQEEKAKVRTATTVRNQRAEAGNIIVRSVILDETGKECSAGEGRMEACANGDSEIVQEIIVENPALWSLEKPVLYTLKTYLLKEDKVIDEYETPFGIRYFEFAPGKGFFLNGVSTKLKGVCNHHDGGAVGSAVPDALTEKRLLMLKEMGCNAIRTSHNPFSPEFYDLCDRIGILVMDEAFDGWEQPKMENDYGLYFEEWWQRDLQDMILRDRNHPCVILWSIGNEVRKMTCETTRKLQDYVHAMDPTRPVTCGVQGAGKESDDNRAILDVAGYNDGGGACFVYGRDHERRPDQCFVATEAPHTYHTRGFYRTQTWWRDKNQPRMEIPNLTEEEIFFDGSKDYASSYDNCGVRTCSRDSWGLAEKYPFLCGEFRWTGFDYLGESHWPRRNSNSGVIDQANFKKDHFYLYQSMWREEPMVHLLPHWTHSGMEDVVIPVWVYTTCEQAELFLNGESLGKKEKRNNKNLSWDVPYQPGEIKAVGYIAGKPVVEKALRTAGEAERIRLSADKTALKADGRDVAQVTFEITDKEGNIVPQADDVVKFVLKGEGTLIGMDNGDPLDLASTKTNCRRAFHGLGMGLVQSTQQMGGIEITAFGVLGENVFKEKAQVSIATSCIAIGQKALEHRCEVFYTLDGKRPKRTSTVYTRPFDITESTVVKAILYEDGNFIAEIEARFTNGERPKVIDLAHGNKELNLDRPVGPFAKKVEGEWFEGDKGIVYCFKTDGEFLRKTGSELEQKLGYWWYDFPSDTFEAQEYAGTGEVWFSSGEKRSISLTTQEAEELVVNIEGAMGTAYGGARQLILKRKI